MNFLILIILFLFPMVAHAQFGGEGAYGSVSGYLGRVNVNVNPAADNLYSLGNAGKRWTSVSSVNFYGDVQTTSNGITYPDNTTQTTAINTKVGAFNPAIQVTDAVRLVNTYPTNAIIWTTDTNFWYRGDGQTAGGVLQTNGLPFTQQELINMGIIQNRSKNILANIQNVVASGSTGSIPNSYGIGDSIMQCAGVDTASTQCWIAVAASDLATFTGVGTTSNWNVTKNLGVGGTTALMIMAYLTDYANPATNYIPERAGIFANNPYFIPITTLRNDATGGTTLANYKKQLRIIFQQAKRHNTDIVAVIDPPEITFATGVLIAAQTATDKTYHDAIIEIAAEENASVVDWWAYTIAINNLGINLKPFYTSVGAQNDGIHPGILLSRDGGHLTSQLMLSQATPTPTYNRPLDNSTWAQLTGVWKNLYNNYLQNWNVAPLGTSPATNSTARAMQLGESTPQIQVSSVSSGQWFFARFNPIVAVIFDWWADANSTGSWTGGYSGNGTISGSTVSMPSSSVSLERQTLFNLASTDNNNVAATPYTSLNTSTGQVSIVGQVQVGALVTEGHVQYPNSTETGTWSNQSFAASTYGWTTVTGRGSSSVGDTVSMRWYGTQFSVSFAQGNDKGKVSWSLDGGGATTVDLYDSAGATGKFYTITTTATTEGWHTTLFTVVTKNASSSANTVLYGRTLTQTSNPDPSYAYISIGSGETVQLTDWWDGAEIVQTLTGRPSITFTRGASSITSTGGSCVVVLSKNGSGALIQNIGNVGIGTTLNVNNLDIKGNAAIGASYAGYQNAPSNGLIIQGNVGIGTTTPPNGLYVVGNGFFTTGLNIGIGTASATRLCIANNQISTCP